MPRDAEFPPGCELIEVHVSDLKQLFNSLDPTPFQGRDLDTEAEEFIVGWARDLHGHAPLGLLVHADREAASGDATGAVRVAVRDHFKRRAETKRRELRQLFRRGRVSLLIGLMFLAACIGLGDLIDTMMPESRPAGILRESLLIGGWVAMWRPLEIFLYEWWPIREDAALSDRLSEMVVRVRRAG